MAKRWRVHPHDPDRIEGLSRAARIPAVVAQLLICRKITDLAQVVDFLDPKLASLCEPEQLPGCSQAAERIQAAIAAGKRIVVYGDYDVDGMTGTALLWLCLKLLGAEVSYYVPHRLEEGYGLSTEAVRTLASSHAGLIITVDCGITGVEPVALARELGVEVVVTDHHEPGPELPDAAAVVHPRLPGGPSCSANLSGSGVAFKLAWALCQRAHGAKKVSPRMRDFLVQALGLAAMGTVADMVPLLEENRILVRHGLASLSRQPTLGLATLAHIAKLDGKRQFDCEDVAFMLAPRLNAAGRLGQPQLAVELLVTDRKDRAVELAQYIDQLNASRQTLERSIFLAANKQAKEEFDPEAHSALVLADRGWHAGVIGIVAGRLVEKYHRPVVMISWDPLGVKPGVGSARSIPGFNLHEALAACGANLVSHGGHAAAAGLKIEERQLVAFRAEFCQYAALRLTDEQRVAELKIDAEVPLSGFTAQTVEQMERLAPFGQGNTRPLLCTTEVTLTEPPRTMGGGGRHLSMRLSQHGVALRAVAFGGADWAEPLAQLGGPIDVAFRPVINAFRGARNVELHVVDWRPTGQAD